MPYLRFDYDSLEDESVPPAEKTEAKFLSVDRNSIFKNLRNQISSKFFGAGLLKMIQMNNFFFVFIAANEKFDLISDGLPPEAVPGLISNGPGSNDEMDDDASSLDSADENFQTEKTFGLI